MAQRWRWIDLDIPVLKTITYTDDANEIFNVATDLKYSREIKAILNQEFKSPSQVFVKHFVGLVYDGRATQNVLDQFTEIVKKTLNIWVSDMINERLKTALNKNENDQDQEMEELVKVSNGHSSTDTEIETTEEEKEGFLIVKTILRQKVPVNRISYRDAKSYCAILLDDNNRKTLCRLRFNGKTKQIGIIDADKNEVKYSIESLDDIFQYSEQINQTADLYLEKEIS